MLRRLLGVGIIYVVLAGILLCVQAPLSYALLIPVGLLSAMGLIVVGLGLMIGDI